MDPTRAHQVARTAGVITAVAGTAMLLAPGPMARLGGLQDRANLRYLTVTDLAFAPGLLAAANPRPWMAARTAASALGAVLVAREPSGRAKVIAAGLAGLAAFDAVATRSLAAPS